MLHWVYIGAKGNMVFHRLIALNSPLFFHKNLPCLCSPLLLATEKLVIQLLSYNFFFAIVRIFALSHEELTGIGIFFSPNNKLKARQNIRNNTLQTL